MKAVIRNIYVGFRTLMLSVGFSNCLLFSVPLFSSKQILSNVLSIENLNGYMSPPLKLTPYKLQIDMTLLKYMGYGTEIIFL